MIPHSMLMRKTTGDFENLDQDYTREERAMQAKMKQSIRIGVFRTPFGEAQLQSALYRDRRISMMGIRQG